MRYFALISVNMSLNAYTLFLPDGNNYLLSPL